MSENQEVGRVLNAIADLLDLAGERFKPEAYRRAARSVEALPEPLSTVEKRGELELIPGVGTAIAEKVREFLRSGRIAYYDRLRAEFPAGLIELMQLPGIGPKTARRFWTELRIEGPAELAQAIEAGRLDGVKGFGPKKIQQFREAVSQTGGPKSRLSLLAADAIARAVVAALRAAGRVEQVEVAGSLRRRRETVGDLDILATSPDPAFVLSAFTKLPQVQSVVLAGGTKATVIYGDGVQIDLRVVEPKSFGAAWQYFTGSKDHNIHLRTIARDRGMKINEYGIFREDEWLAGRTEADVYEQLGLSWMPPEIRENHGEIEAALQHQVPTLVEVGDVRGVLHLHLGPETSVAELDGLMTAARSRGWQYLGVVPHARGDRGRRTPAKPNVLSRLQHLRSEHQPPRVLLVDERTSFQERSLSSSETSGDYWVLDASHLGEDPSPVRKTTAPPWVIAHPSPGLDAGATAAVLQRMRPLKAALDVTPDPMVDGPEASVVRQWVGNEGVVCISPGGLGNVDSTRMEVAVGLARRGWTPPALLVNGLTFDKLTARFAGPTRNVRRPA